MSKKKSNKKRKAHESLLRQISANRQPSRVIGVSRLIEDKLELLTSSSFECDLSYPIFSTDAGVAQTESTEVIEYEEQSQSSSMRFEFEALYVLEPNDLEELSLEEVEIVWKNRYELCGSDRAAAEALSIFEVASEITDSYKGWQAYLNRPEC